MGRKNKRKNKERLQKLDKMFPVEDEDSAMFDFSEGKRTAKALSKLKKKERKKALRQKMRETVKQISEVKFKCSWIKISVKGNTHLEKDFVLSSIRNIVDIEFSPLGFCKLVNGSCFFLENNGPAAQAIVGLDKRLQGPDSSVLRITSQKCDGPDLALNSDQIQVLRECLSSRYNRDMSLLDLSNLHNDPLLKERDILTPLQTPLIMKQVMKVVKENVPELKALSLSNNNLRRSDLEGLQALQNSCSQLAALNLEHNNICDLKVLNIIKVFPLTELNLQFNPIVETYKDRPVSYIKEVRSRLGNLKVLDTIDIDSYLAENDKSGNKFDINFSKNEKLLCESASSSNSEFEVSDAVVRMFLDQYFGLVDTPDRVNLVAAYTPDAVLEVKSNLDNISNAVYVGHDRITKALMSLPATQHDHSSFSLHIQPLSQKTTRAEVTGQCRVAGVDTVVAFLRIMSVVPFNTGFCCSQDKFELRKLTGA